MITIYKTPCFDIHKLSLNELKTRYGNLKNGSGKNGRILKQDLITHIILTTPVIGNRHDNCINTVRLPIGKDDYYFEVICGQIQLHRNHYATFKELRENMYLYITDNDDKVIVNKNNKWVFPLGSGFCCYKGNSHIMLNTFRDITLFIKIFKWYNNIYKLNLMDDIRKHIGLMLIRHYAIMITCIIK